MKSQNKSRAQLNEEANSLTRNKLKLSALRCMKSKSCSVLKVADIVKEAKLARGTFYLHFKDVQCLLRELSIDFMNGLERNLSALPVTLQIDELIEGVMACYVNYVSQRPMEAKLVFQLIGEDGEVAFHFDSFAQRWSTYSANAIQKTEFSNKEIGALERLSFSMICMMEGYYRSVLRESNRTLLGLKDDSPEAVIAMFTSIWKKSIASTS